MSAVLEEAEVPLGCGHEPLHVGHCTLSLLPHHLHTVGPRVFLVVETPSLHEPVNLTPDQARLLADRLKMAACEAETKTKRALRRAQLLNNNTKGESP